MKDRTKWYPEFHRALQGTRIRIHGKIVDKITLYHYLPTSMIGRIIICNGNGLNALGLPETVSLEAKDQENWGKL
jgi:hypothetical protein